jgi:1-deoxy-D-xylulose-5-phosphate reductoisomerase
MRRVVLLGSTGSIGTQTVDVVTAAAGRFEVTAVCAGGSDVALLAEQAAQLRVRAVGVTRPDRADALRDALAAVWPGDVPEPRVLAGPEVTTELAGQPADVVLNAVAGAQGLRATLAALRAGSIVALANKESLVAGGPLVTELAGAGQLVPVDSEHSALAQCLRGGSPDEVRRLLLTASGGPFRGRGRAELSHVTPGEALAHPTWDMGPLVTTNSATLVNKGLELIEAHLLFGVPYERIDVVVHPQSVVHSMVEFTDGSTIAQASPPDAEAFPAVDLARRAGEAGGCAPAVYNAANEVLVAAFHEGKVGFLQIVDTVAEVLDDWLSSRHQQAGNPRTVEDVEQADAWARARATA